MVFFSFLPFWQLLISMQRLKNDLQQPFHYIWYIHFWNNVCCFIFVRGILSLYGNALESDLFESLLLTDDVFMCWSAI